MWQVKWDTIPLQSGPRHQICQSTNTRRGSRRRLTCTSVTSAPLGTVVGPPIPRSGQVRAAAHASPGRRRCDSLSVLHGPWSPTPAPLQRCPRALCRYPSRSPASKDKATPPARCRRQLASTATRCKTRRPSRRSRAATQTTTCRCVAS